MGIRLGWDGNLFGPGFVAGVKGGTGLGRTLALEGGNGLKKDSGLEVLTGAIGKEGMRKDSRFGGRNGMQKGFGFGITGWSVELGEALRKLSLVGDVVLNRARVLTFYLPWISQLQEAQNLVWRVDSDATELHYCI
jgi:hypothetical protein